MNRPTKNKLFDRFDLTNLQFYLFLPTYNTINRRNLSKRIAEYGGKVALNVKKEENTIVIISDNLQDLNMADVNWTLELKADHNVVPKLTIPGSDYTSKMPRFKLLRSLNPQFDLDKSDKPDKMNTLLNAKGSQDKIVWRQFIASKTTAPQHKAHEVHDKLNQLETMGIPMIKICEFLQVLDYFDSFTKFQWHAKRDDWRMLRSLVNGHGCFIVTSWKKIYMKLRHRMEFHKFSSLIDQRGKLDIPKLYLKASKGSSLFQTPTEIDYTLKKEVKIEKMYEDMIWNIKQGGVHKPVTPWKDNDKMWSKILLDEFKPK